MSARATRTLWFIVGTAISLPLMAGCASPGPAVQGGGYVIQGASRVPANMPDSLPVPGAIPVPGGLPTHTGPPPRYGGTAPTWGPGYTPPPAPAPVYPPQASRYPSTPGASPGAVTQAAPPVAYPPPAAGNGSPAPSYPSTTYGGGARYGGGIAPVPQTPPGVFAPIQPGLTPGLRPLPARRQLGEKELALDSDGDGTPDTWFTVTEGRITRVTRDNDHDGKSDFTSSFSREEGLPTSEVQYRGDTGQVAEKTEFDSGVKRKREADDNGDGQPDHWWYYLGGDLSKEAWDRDADGKIDEARHYRKGQVARVEYDEDRDGKFEKSDFMKGDRIMRSEILDQDGILTRVYDEQGARVVREERDGDGDGQVELVTVLNASGGKVREDRDLNGDDRADVSAYYEGGKLVRREISGSYLRAQKTPDSAAPSVDVEQRDFRKLSGS